MRAIVTGGAGFIGSHVVDQLRRAGHDVSVIDDLSAGSPLNLAGDVRIIELDIASGPVDRVFARLRPDVVVHAAAQVSVSQAVADPATDARTNVIGTIRAIQGAVESNARQFIYLTTGGALYGEPVYLPCDETHPIRPLSPYGLSKWVGEEYLRLLGPSLRRTVMRLANVYGPRQSSDGEAGVVAIFASRMLLGEGVEIHGDGGQTRDFVHVRDVAAAVVAAVGAKADAVLNIGTGTATSVFDLFRAVASLTGYPLQPVMRPPRPGDVRHSVLAVEAAERELAWKATTSLHDGLRSTVDWYRDTLQATRSSLTDG